jgi:hypothetical protein
MCGMSAAPRSVTLEQCLNVVYGSSIMIRRHLASSRFGKLIVNKPCLCMAVAFSSSTKDGSRKSRMNLPSWAEQGLGQCLPPVLRQLGLAPITWLSISNDQQINCRGEKSRGGVENEPFGGIDSMSHKPYHNLSVAVEHRS